MKVYAVFKEAVYRHECCGIFTTQPLAEACALAVAEHEDGHHEAHVVPFDLDVRGALIPPGEDDWGKATVAEPGAVVIYRREKSWGRPPQPVTRVECP